MSIHKATIEWHRDGKTFLDLRYSRAHAWRFDGGALVAASSSPAVVKSPYSDPAAVDPEEAFVASLASCHMLWLLSIAAEDGYVIDRYIDEAEGHMVRREDGKDWIARVVLHPALRFTGARAPDDALVRDLHHRAHAACFIANSVRTEVSTEGTWTYD